MRILLVTADARVEEDGYSSYTESSATYALCRKAAPPRSCCKFLYLVVQVPSAPLRACTLSYCSFLQLPLLASLAF